MDAQPVLFTSLKVNPSGILS